MRAQENNLVGGLTSSSTTATVVNNTNNNEKFNANNTTSCTTTSCPNKGKIQTLRQRKTELERLLEEKNVLLQQIQRQEAQIVGNEWSTTSSSSLSATPIDISSTGNNKDDQIIGGQQSTSSTLRRKVGSSFKLPRIVKKEHQTDIENLLLEKKLQQDICNTSYKLANDLTLSKSVRGSQKAEYEAAQQKLNLINQNLNVLKKRQLRSHSTSFSENLLTQNNNNNNNGNNSNSDYMNHNNANTINNGDISSLNLKTSPLSLTSSLASPQPSFSQPTATILSTNLRNNTNYNLNSNNSGDCTLLIPSKRTNNTLPGTTTNAYTTNKINNNNSIKNNKSVSNNNISTNNSISNNNNVNSYLSSDRRNSIKSAILNSSSKHNSTSSSSSSTGLVQHFDRTLKNHRSDYDINRIMPSQHIDKYQFNEEFCTNINRLNDSYSVDNNGDAVELSNGDLNYSNNYCNTFPIQLQYQRNHYNVIDCNLSSTSSQNILKQQQHNHQQQTQGQNQLHPQYITTAENYDDNYYNRGTIYDNSEFEVINNRNRVSENFEKSSGVNTKDGRYYVGVQQSLQNNVTSYDNDDSNINFYPRNSNTIYSTNSDHNITQTCGNDWKQNKVYNDSSSFDAVSYFQSVNNQSTNSLNAAQQQQQQTGLGGFWKILPNNERIWYSTTDDNDDQRTISSIQQKNKLQQQIQNSYLSDDVSSIITPTTKDENNSDKISISSINSETNKKSREKQWLETLLDTPIIQPKHSTLINNQQDCGITTIQQQQPRPVSHQYLYHYHHHDATNIYPSTQLVQYNLNTIPNAFYPANHKVHSNGYKERSKLSSQSMSNKTYQRSTIQQRLEDQSRLSHSTSVLNKQFTDHHHYHHQQQQKQLENQSHNNNNNNTLMNSNENIILNYHNNEIIGNEIDKLHHQKQQHQHQQQQPHYHQQIQQQQQQSQSNYHTLFHQSSPNHHHHHYHMLPQSTNNTSRITNNIDDNNMIPSSESLSYITASASSPSPVASSLNTTTAAASNLSSSNNFYNKTALITNAINKAQDIRVESPKNMTVIQKAVFVPYKEVTKPFEMSDFYKYSTKFRQKDNQQQQLITSINNSSTINTSKQSQQQQQQPQQQFNIGTINTNNNNNVKNYETRNTATVVEKVK